jgi:hypothetical protein
MAAFGNGGGTTGSSGALRSLADNSWGTFALVLIAIGMFGYGLWRLLSATLDLENEGNDGKAIAKRVGHAASGIAHFGLSIYAVSLVSGSGGGGSSGGAESMTAKLMQAPFGPALVVIAGIIAFVVAGFQIRKAPAEKYRRHISLPDHHGVSNKLIKFGIISRGVVFAIIGGFLVYAGITVNPDQARGVGGALSWLQQQSYGSILLGLIAIGLLGFALYSFLQARYRIIPDPEKGTGNATAQAAN